MWFGNKQSKYQQKLALILLTVKCVAIIKSKVTANRGNIENKGDIQIEVK